MNEYKYGTRNRTSRKMLTKQVNEVLKDLAWHKSSDGLDMLQDKGINGVYNIEVSMIEQLLQNMDPQDMFRAVQNIVLRCSTTTDSDEVHDKLLPMVRASKVLD